MKKHIKNIYEKVEDVLVHVIIPSAGVGKRMKSYGCKSLLSIKDEKLLSEFFLMYDIKFTEIDTAMNQFTSIRNKLRNEKKYGEADEMRDSILKIGIVINDGENVGWYWKNS